MLVATEPVCGAPVPAPPLHWLNCVQDKHKPIGLAEYGLDCTTTPDQPIVTQTMVADDSYLAAIPDAVQPTIMWEYWWADTGNSSPGCVFDNSVGGITEWQSIETQTEERPFC